MSYSLFTAASAVPASMAFIIWVAFVVTATVEAHNSGATRHYKFNIQYENVTRLCHTKSMVTVNGEYPGPTIWAREGDRLVIKVTNHLHDRNISIHWHGIRQLRTGWFDGPAYVTQCPIQPGHSYTYNFTISGQRGTLWWHAHLSWMRATVHGAIIIFPKHGVLYPFKKPFKEIPIVLGEWWNADTETVIKQALLGGAAPNNSDAFTINGQPGPLYKCSAEDAFQFHVKPNKTYLLRIINAALNEELFFSIANHTMTVVEIDAVYTKPFTTDALLITPGQSTNVLFTSHQMEGKYYIAARPYVSAPNVQLDNTTTAAVLEYIIVNGTSSSSSSSSSSPPHFPYHLPSLNDTNFATSFTKRLRSLASSRYPARVPQAIDKELFFTIGLALKPNCTGHQDCKAASLKPAGAINNVSFVLPRTALLQAHYRNMKGVFSEDFPDFPSSPFNYTGPQLSNLEAEQGTRLSSIAFNSSVQLILQDTSTLGFENHPIHLHGFNFFVVGQGVGNYDRRFHPANFNLVDPPERNTVGVPAGGWVALRFRADNPGVWFMHCHLEVHTSWGLEMAFAVENGPSPHFSILPPPQDLPSC